MQQQLSSPCDEETASLLSNCCMLQEKDRLREDWETLEEQRKIFERERRNFTEAAIRLSHEVVYGHIFYAVFILFFIQFYLSANTEFKKRRLF